MSQAVEKSPHEMAGVSLRDMANAIRALSMDAVQKANSGQPGMRLISFLLAWMALRMLGWSA